MELGVHVDELVLQLDLVAVVQRLVDLLPPDEDGVQLGVAHGGVVLGSNLQVPIALARACRLAGARGLRYFKLGRLRGAAHARRFLSPPLFRRI